MLSICQGQIQLKVKCQGHVMVNYLNLFLVANYAMTPCDEGQGHSKVKYQGQGDFKVKYLIFPAITIYA